VLHSRRGLGVSLVQSARFVHNVVLSFCRASDSVILLSLLPFCFPSHFPCPCSSSFSCNQLIMSRTFRGITNSRLHHPHHTITTSNTPITEGSGSSVVYIPASSCPQNARSFRIRSNTGQNAVLNSVVTQFGGGSVDSAQFIGPEKGIDPNQPRER
jgi:hypothetical protein